MTARQLRIAVPIALASMTAATLATDDLPLLRPGETVRLEMPKGAPEKTLVALQLVATEDGPLTVEASTLYFDTLLQVFDAGAAEGAKPIAEDDDGGVAWNSRVSFTGRAGKSYRLEVRAVADDWGGPFEVSVAAGPPPQLTAEAVRERTAAYWDTVAAEAERTGSALLQDRVGAGRRSLMHHSLNALAEGLSPAEESEQPRPFLTLLRPMLEQAVAVREKTLGPEHPDTAESLDKLAKLLVVLGEDESARPLYERALAIREKVLGAEHVDTGVSLAHLGVLLTKVGDHASARPLLERALAITENVRGAEHPDTALRLNDLASLLKEMGDYASARPLLERTLAIREGALGPKHRGTANALNNLALLLEDMGEYASARPLLERALAIEEKVHGPEHPDTARKVNNLASLLQDMGEYASARPLFERSLAIREKVFGAEHPDTAMGLNNLALLLKDMGEYASARLLFERALAIEEKVYGPAHPDTANGLNSLALVLGAMGEYASARPLYERSLAIKEEVYGPEHRDTSLGLNNLALLLKAMGEYASARPLLERALAIVEKVHGPEHRDTAIALKNLASLQQAMGEYASARALYERSLAIRERVHGPAHPATAMGLSNLAGLLEDEGEYATAWLLYDRALGIDEKAHGPAHPATARGLSNLARLFRKLGQHASARPLYERALAIYERALGPDHPDTGGVLAGLARTYEALGEPGPAVDAALRAESIGVAHLARTARTMSEEAALRYAAVRVQGLDLALSVLAKGGDEVRRSAARTLEAVAASRGLVLDEVASRHRRVSATVRLARELGESSEAMAKLMVRGASATDLEAARRRREGAERELARASEASSAGWSPPKLAEVALGLPPDGALVAFVRHERVPFYLAFVLRKGASAPAVVSLGEAGPIDALVEAWKREAGSGAARSAGEKAYRKAGEALRRAVWDPLSASIAGARHLFIVPDGALHLVSFAALPVGESSYLIESGPWIHYLSAERDLVPEPNAPGSSAGLLALGGPSFDAGKAPGALVASAAASRGNHSPPATFRGLRFEALPGTAAEAAEIVRLWRERKRPSYQVTAAPEEPAVLLEGAAASEAAFKERAPGHRVLHLATHGFFLGGAGEQRIESGRGIGGLAAPSSPDPTAEPIPAVKAENPLLLSGLALAGANQRDEAGPDEDDGILTAEEIASLDLTGTEWAVLSACDTGVGDVRAGEGVFGLRRAFRVAGAGTLIMSLWSVDDEATRGWMSALYDARLNRRMGTAEAVREAGLSVLRARREAGASTHPFYWGAFVAAGDWK